MEKRKARACMAGIATAAIIYAAANTVIDLRREKPPQNTPSLEQRLEAACEPLTEHGDYARGDLDGNGVADSATVSYSPARAGINRMRPAEISVVYRPNGGGFKRISGLDPFTIRPCAMILDVNGDSKNELVIASKDDLGDGLMVGLSVSFNGSTYSVTPLHEYK